MTSYFSIGVWSTYTLHFVFGGLSIKAVKRIKSGITSFRWTRFLLPLKIVSLIYLLTNLS